MTNEEWLALSDEDRNVAFAKLTGWEYDGPVYYQKHEAQGFWSRGEDSRLGISDFIHDLNYIHDSEKLITKYGDRCVYVNNIYGIMCRDINGAMFREGSNTPTDTLTFATAGQKAQAFVMTMDKKEDKRTLKEKIVNVKERNVDIKFINRQSLCGCKINVSEGNGLYSDVIYITMCDKHRRK